MQQHRFETGAVIGTGMMGPGIAVTLALGGVRTVLVSRTEQGATTGLEKVLKRIRTLEEHGLIDSGRAALARSLVAPSRDFDGAVAGADIAIESTPEKMEFKQDLFARMDGIAKASAVLASNTSGLSITAIASKCSRPERTLTTHFWNPPHLMPLVEIVCGDRTASEVAAQVRSFLEYCGKTPVLVKKDRPGQLGNRLQMALWREAVNIVAEGIADAEDVDLAVMRGFGLRLPVYGIFEHADAVGLAMVRDVMEYVSQDLYGAPHAPRLINELVARGETGAAAGKGFYDWSKKDFRRVLERRDRFVLDVLRKEKSEP